MGIRPKQIEGNFHFSRWKWKRDRQKSDRGKRRRNKIYLVADRCPLTSILLINWNEKKKGWKGQILFYLPSTVRLLAVMKAWKRGKVSTSQTIVVSNWQQNQNKIKTGFSINQVHYCFKMSMILSYPLNRIKGLIYFYLFIFYPMGCIAVHCNIWQRSMFPEHYSVSVPGLMKKKINDIHRN